MASIAGHRLLIDDSVSAASDTDGAAFVYVESDNEGTCAPSWNYTCSTTQEFTLRFKGTGVSIFGAAVCITSSTPSSSTQEPISHMSILDGSVVPSGTGGSYSEPHLYQVSGLPSGSWHTVEYISSPCEEGGVANISYVDFALSVLDARTEIERGMDVLVATYDDPFVVFSENGGWAMEERAALERLESRASTRVRANAGYLDGMETSEVGDWVSFEFFGDRVSAFGSLYYQDALVQFPQTPDWMVELSLSVTLDGMKSDHDFPNPSVVSFPFFESGTLEALPDGAPHVVNISLREPPVSDGKLRVEGFMYRPTFGTVEEGNRMFAAWRDGAVEDDPNPAEDRPSDEGRPNLAGPIAGGVVGGIVVLVLVGLFLWYRRRKQRNSKNDDDQEKDTGYLRPPITQAAAEVSDETALRPGSVRPYMKSYSDCDSSRGAALNSLPPPNPTDAVPYTKTYRETSSEPTSVSPAVTGTGTDVSPYMKSYRGTNNTSALSPGRASSTVAPFLKSYEEFDPNSLIPSSPGGSSSQNHLHSTSTSPVENSSVLPGSQRLSSSAGEEPPSGRLDPPPPREGGYPAAPPSFRSDDEESGPNTEAPTTRLMGIIQRMRAEMDAMEAPPPYDPSRDPDGNGQRPP